MKNLRYAILISIILLFSSLAQAAPPAPSTAQQTLITPVRETIHQAEALVVGDVQKVLAGSLKQQDFKKIPLKDILFALGAGSIENIQDTGEMLSVDGRAYVKTTDELFGFPVLGAKEKISTPFAIGVKKNKGPGAVYYLNSPEGITVSELYGYLLSKTKGRAGIVIYGRWRSLATTALRRAPVYNQPIMEEKNRGQYFHPQEFLWEQKALACGLAVAKEAVTIPERPVLSRMFYVNFADVRAGPQEGPEILDHTHILILADQKDRSVKEEDLEALLSGKEPKISDVRHLLSQSTLYEGIIYVYPLSSFHEFTTAP